MPKKRLTLRDTLRSPDNLGEELRQAAGKAVQLSVDPEEKNNPSIDREQTRKQEEKQEFGQTIPDQLRDGQTSSDMVRYGQTYSDQLRDGQSRPDYTRVDQSRSDQVRPYQSRPDYTRVDQNSSGQLESYQDNNIADIKSKNQAILLSFLLEKGNIETCYAQLSKLTNINIHTTRKAINALRSKGFIQINSQNDPRFGLVIFINRNLSTLALGKYFSWSDYTRVGQSRSETVRPGQSRSDQVRDGQGYPVERKKDNYHSFLPSYQPRSDQVRDGQSRPDHIRVDQNRLGSEKPHGLNQIDSLKEKYSFANNVNESLKYLCPMLYEKGFNQNILIKLARIFNAEDVQVKSSEIIEGIRRAEYALANNLMKDRNGQQINKPAHYVFQVLKNEQCYPHPGEGYKSPAELRRLEEIKERERIAREEAKAAQAELEALKAKQELQKEKEKLEFDEWKGSLSKEDEDKYKKEAPHGAAADHWLFIKWKEAKKNGTL